MRNTAEYFVRKPEWKSPLEITRLGRRKILTIGYCEYRKRHWASKKAGNFLNSLASIGFSRSTLLCGISHSTLRCLY
jgi:hypothetical protein